MSAQATYKARLELRRLLDGQAPSDLPLGEFGPWLEHVRALRDAYIESGTEGVRAVFNAMAAADPALVQLVAAGRERKTVWTAKELLQATFPDPDWIVPGLLPTGLTCLAGRPKIGKSFLLLQLAIAVSAGGRFFGQPVKQGRVLFLALEDRERRLQKRLRDLGATPSDDLVLATQWPAFDQGGLAKLQSEMETGRYCLTCIDTFSRVAGRLDQNDVAAMTAIMSNLQELAQSRSIIISDHHVKPAGYGSGGIGGDPVNDILGSTAKAAVTDTVWGLYRKQGTHETLLKVVGRDIEERELALRWDGLTHCWQLLGEAGQVRKNSAEAEVIEAIETLPKIGELPTTTRIARHIGKDKANVSRILAELTARGVIARGPAIGREQPYYVVQQHQH